MIENGEFIVLLLLQRLLTDWPTLLLLLLDIVGKIAEGLINSFQHGDMLVAGR